MNSKMAFVGGGNMAEALIKGLVAPGGIPAGDVTVSDVNPERLDALSKTYGVKTVSDNAMAVQDADVVWLCVKPQQMNEVLAGLSAAVPKALFVSIAAGVTTSTLEAGLGEDARVVRVMPNTPALVGQGAAGLSGGSHATDSDLKQVLSWMGCVGHAVQVEEEDLHAVTALSGSGPAYVFYLVEAMLIAAEACGLEARTARELAVQTVKGAACLLEAEPDLTAGELRERVTSKGGTTAAALEAFRAAGVGEGIQLGVQAAARRSRELAEGA